MFAILAIIFLLFCHIVKICVFALFFRVLFLCIFTYTTYIYVFLKYNLHVSKIAVYL